MGLPKVNRLKERRDFQLICQSGIRRYSPLMTLRAIKVQKAPLEQKSLSPTRLGISVSLKVSKKAVNRNRIKRLIRVAFRELLPQIAPGWKILLIVRQEAVGCKYERFLRELKQLLLEAGIIHGH